MKKTLLLFSFFLVAATSFGQFADTATLNGYIRDNIKDKRPEKVTALQIQSALLGVSQMASKSLPWWSVTKQPDTVFSDHNHVPTSLAIKNFVAGRIANIPGGVGGGSQSLKQTLSLGRFSGSNGIVFDSAAIPMQVNSVLVPGSWTYKMTIDGDGDAAAVSWWRRMGDTTNATMIAGGEVMTRELGLLHPTGGYAALDVVGGGSVYFSVYSKPGRSSDTLATKDDLRNSAIMGVLSSGAINWQGKLVAVGFDSYTDASREDIYIDTIQTVLGVTTVTNTVAGSCLTGGTVHANGDGTARVPFVDRIDAFLAANTTLDGAIFGTFSNDWYYGAPLGTPGSTDTLNFYGALDYLAKKCVAYNRKFRVIWTTPIQANLAPHAGGTAGRGNYASQLSYVNAIKEVAAKYSIPVCDFFNGSGMAYENLALYATDGIHPNTTAGRAMYSRFLTAFMEAPITTYSPTASGAVASVFTDSILVAASAPETGNVYVNSATNRLNYKSNGYWYKVAIVDSVAIGGGEEDPGGATGTLEPIIFDVNVNGLTNVAGVWQGSNSGTYDNFGISSQALEAGENGYIEFHYIDGTTTEIMLAFKVDAETGNYTKGYDAGIWVNGPSTVYLADTDDTDYSNSGYTGAMTAGNWYRVNRVGSVLTYETSADHSTWTVLYTFSFSSTAKLYVHTNMNGTSARLNNPKGFNLTP